MGFWILVLLLICATTALLAIGARRARALTSGEADLALYRDQLKELDRDLARGMLSPDEAERSKLEVSRRLLAADRALRGQAHGRGGPLNAALLVSGVALAGAVVVYAGVGNPQMPDLPRSARLAAAAEAKANRPAQAEMEAALPAWQAAAEVDPNYLQLIEQLRAAVIRFPDEQQGWEYLVQHETALGNLAAAWRAQEKLIALRQAAGRMPTAEELSLQGALMTEAAGGRISPEAETLFTRALQVNPEDGSALFHAGLVYLQTGRPDRTFEIWAPLLARSAADAPWTTTLRNLLPAVAALAGQRRYTLPPESGALARGPSAADIEAAAEMDADARAEMISGMVESLAERLAREGGPAADWARLIRALGVLGQTERAGAIYQEALNVFAGRNGDLAELRSAASAAGVAN